MRHRAIIGALLFVGVGVFLGTTVFRADIAQATGLKQSQSVIVDNTAAQAVPVREQNLDAGNIKVHEQGTANVNVTNASLAVTPPAATGGSFAIQIASALLGSDDQHTAVQTASAISITMETGVAELVLKYQGNEVAQFYGPSSHGHSSVDLALAQPIKFDEVICVGVGGYCSLSTVGN